MKVDLKVNKKHNYSEFFGQPKSMLYSPDENKSLKDYDSLFAIKLDNSKNSTNYIFDQNYKYYKNFKNYKNKTNETTKKDYNKLEMKKNGTMYKSFFENNRLTQYYSHHSTKIRRLLNCSKHEIILDSMKKEHNAKSMKRIFSINSIKQIKNSSKVNTCNSKIKFCKKKTYTMSLVDQLCENINKYRKLNPKNRNENHLNQTTYQGFNRRAFSYNEPKFQIQIKKNKEKEIKKARYHFEQKWQNKNLCLEKMILRIDNNKNNFIKKIHMNQKSFIIHFNKKGRLLNTSNLSSNYNSKCINFVPML